MGELRHLSAIPMEIGGESTAKKVQGIPPPPRTCQVCGAELHPFLNPMGRWIERFCECERAIRREEREQKALQQKLYDMAIYTYGGWLGDEWVSLPFVKELATKRFHTYDTTRHAEFERLQRAYDRESSPERKRLWRENMEAVEQDRKTLQTALDTVRAYAANPEGVLLLHGSHGLGKSHLLAAICNMRRKNGLSSAFVVVPTFFSAYYERLNHEHTEWELFRRAVTTKFLVLDDLDKSGPKEFRRDIFYQIIEQRTTARLPLAISTNKMEELQAYVGEAAYSRLQRQCTSVRLAGADYRINQIAKGGIS